ncbi:MAG: hypothetical protein HUJ26_08090 [Planctomycetaceae bacterium]|nr:hypothetical protein [Planctomycetaceae bacterium]
MRLSAASIPIEKRRAAMRRMLIALILFAIVIPGCSLLNRQEGLVSLPSKHTVRSDQLLVLSDFRISPNHELIQDLKQLRQQVYQHLDLPVQKRPVTVYLFNHEQAYRHYLAEMYPGLPHRRAYFFKTSTELAVFTYWGERVQEDLRHEFTHGLLHASLKHVPLWLDEGLAEYFEVAGDQPGELNSNYPSELTAKIGNGWKPNLRRLENLEEFADLQRLDYQESWAWVHFMLHHSPETREALIGYLSDLRTQNKPYRLSNRLKVAQADFENRFLSYVASLNTFSDSMAEPNRLLTERNRADSEQSPPSRHLDETGWVTLSADRNSAINLPEYSLTLPEHVSGRMMMTGAEGNVKFGDGPQVYRDAHRHGWDDFLRLFLAEEIDLSDPEAVKQFANRPSTEDWDLAKEARGQGIYDCYQALRKQSEIRGASLLRDEFQTPDWQD